MKRLSFVTGNKGKLAEAKAYFAPLGFEVVAADVSPVEIQSDSLAEVARAKAEDATRRVAPPFFLDDAGLFVDALSGFPGVYSAYALRTLGLPGLLRLLAGASDRRARFECAIAYVGETREVRLFSGRCGGRIAEEPRSRGEGFGFDPVFVPEGFNETFAELPVAVKNRISHRGRALAAFSAAIIGPRE